MRALQDRVFLSTLDRVGGRKKLATRAVPAFINEGLIIFQSGSTALHIHFQNRRHIWLYQTLT